MHAMKRGKEITRLGRVQISVGLGTRTVSDSPRWIFGYRGHFRPRSGSFFSQNFATEFFAQKLWHLQKYVLYKKNLYNKCSICCVVVLFIEFFLVSVFIPKDRVTSIHQGFAFVEFKGEEDADYALKIMNMIKLYGRKSLLFKCHLVFMRNLRHLFSLPVCRKAYPSQQIQSR